MTEGKQVSHLYPPFIVGGFWVMDGGATMDQAARRLSGEHYNVLFAQRWLLGNIDRAPVDVHRVNFDLLRWMCDQDAAANERTIGAGAFMAALIILNYQYRPQLDGIWIGCTAASVREVARRQVRKDVQSNG
jgi:hypothetical protein